MVAWDTGLRWGDLVTLQADQIGADGLVVRPQRKTGRPYIGRISASTAEATRRSLERTPLGTVFPWEASHETFCAQFRHLTELAGVRMGTWKWLRRGSATDVELERPGSASAHLGHKPGSTIAATNYLDPAILGAARRGPGNFFDEKAAKNSIFGVGSYVRSGSLPGGRRRRPGKDPLGRGVHPPCVHPPKSRRQGAGLLRQRNNHSSPLIGPSLVPIRTSTRGGSARGGRASRVPSHPVSRR